MAHIAKYKSVGLMNLFKHYERETKLRKDNIDYEKTKNNYYYTEELSSSDLYKKLKKVLERPDVHFQKRNDINLVADWIITLPKGFQGSEKEFFEKCNDFICQRYKTAVPLISVVHMDEKTPHIHFCFIPLVEDKRKGGLKLSAKELITRRDLQSFHTDLQKFLCTELNLPISDVCVLNGATANGNKTITELKVEALLKKQAKIKQKNINMNEQFQSSYAEKLLQIKEMTNEIEKLKAEINKLYQSIETEVGITTNFNQTKNKDNELIR